MAGCGSKEAEMATKTKRNRKPTARGTNTKTAPNRRRHTKADVILKLLRRPTGASVAELTKAAGWQPHSVRAALTGLRKKGHEIARAKDARGVTRYSIAAESQ
jgi:hypothetical protein